VHARRENLARKAAARDATGDLDDDVPAGDDETLESELRQERAMAAASSVPARNPKAAQTRRRPTGKQTGRPAGKQGGRPSGKKRH
jgi:preprotein translocase subunit SecF